MKKGIMILAAAGVLGITVTVAAATARQASDFRDRRASFIARHIAADLSLTDDQKAQIKTILVTERPAIQALLHRIEQQNDQLHSKPYDEAFVRSVAQQEAENVAEAIVEREKIRGEIMTVLTPDQQKKITQISSEVRSVIDDRVSQLGDGL
jgi:Spy/CpxP family protein refolding chaperone